MGLSISKNDIPIYQQSCNDNIQLDNQQNVLYDKLDVKFLNLIISHQEFVLDEFKDLTVLNEVFVMIHPNVSQKCKNRQVNWLQTNINAGRFIRCVLSDKNNNSFYWLDISFYHDKITLNKMKPDNLLFSFNNECKVQRYYGCYTEFDISDFLKKLFNIKKYYYDVIELNSKHMCQYFIQQLINENEFVELVTFDSGNRIKFDLISKEFNGINNENDFREFDLQSTINQFIETIIAIEPNILASKIQKVSMIEKIYQKQDKFVDLFKYLGQNDDLENHDELFFNQYDISTLIIDKVVENQQYTCDVEDLSWLEINSMQMLSQIKNKVFLRIELENNMIIDIDFHEKIVVNIEYTQNKMKEKRVRMGYETFRDKHKTLITNSCSKDMTVFEFIDSLFKMLKNDKTSQGIAILQNIYYLITDNSDILKNKSQSTNFIELVNKNLENQRNGSGKIKRRNTKDKINELLGPDKLRPEKRISGENDKKRSKEIDFKNFKNMPNQQKNNDNKNKNKDQFSQASSSFLQNVTQKSVLDKLIEGTEDTSRSNSNDNDYENEEKVKQFMEYMKTKEYTLEKLKRFNQFLYDHSNVQMTEIHEDIRSGFSQADKSVKSVKSVKSGFQMNDIDEVDNIQELDLMNNGEIIILNMDNISPNNKQVIEDKSVSQETSSVIIYDQLKKEKGILKPKSTIDYQSKKDSDQMNHLPSKKSSAKVNFVTPSCQTRKSETSMFSVNAIDPDVLINSILKFEDGHQTPPIDNNSEASASFESKIFNSSVSAAAETQIFDPINQAFVSKQKQNEIHNDQFEFESRKSKTQDQVSEVDKDFNIDQNDINELRCFMSENNDEDSQFQIDQVQSHQNLDIELDFDEIIVEKKIGEGVEGVIYRATQNGRKYAVKYQKIAHSDKKTIQTKINSIIQKYRYLKKLNHQNLVKQFKIDVPKVQTIDYSLKIVMSQVDGVDLNNLIKDMKARGKKMSNYNLKIIIKQMVDGIAFLHENKIIHRDIKPSNIMIDKEWNVFVTDQGVSKVLETDNSLTLTAIGTPLYTAPEVWDGHQGFAADVQSLGCCMLALETLNNPQEGESNVQFLKQVQQEITPYYFQKKRNGNLRDENLNQMIQHCCSFDPQNRPKVNDLIGNAYFK